MKIVVLLALICLSLSHPTDIVVNADLFLENFYSAAFGIDLHLDTCEGDAANVVQVINEAMGMVTDWTSVTQLTKAAMFIVNSKDLFFNTY